MADRALRLKKGQTLLETLITFVVIVLLFGGIFNIWIWANKQIVNRQVKYNAGRVKAGTSTQDYELAWPVGRSESLNNSKTFVDLPGS